MNKRKEDMARLASALIELIGNRVAATDNDLDWRDALYAVGLACNGLEQIAVLETGMDQKTVRRDLLNLFLHALDQPAVLVERSEAATPEEAGTVRAELIIKGSAH